MQMPLELGYKRSDSSVFSVMVIDLIYEFTGIILTQLVGDRDGNGSDSDRMYRHPNPIQLIIGFENPIQIRLRRIKCYVQFAF